MKRRFKLPIILIYYLALAVAIVYPLYRTGLLFDGYDQVFHLSRAHELASALKQGHLTYGYAINGFNKVGQAIGVFYPSLSVAVLAFFQLFNGHLVVSTYLATALTVFLGLLISHYSIRRLHRSNLNALLFGSLYIGSTMFMQVCFVWFDMGWLWAFILIPLVYSGFIQIFYYDHSSGVDFTLGIVALLLSHIISFLLVILSFVFAVLIISMFQRTFWPHFRKLLISGILGMGCTAFFWVKFVQVYFSNNINGVVKLDSSLYALKPSNVVIDSLNNTSITSNVGLIILIVGLCLLASKGGLAKLDNYVLYGALICAFLSSSLFPWIHVQKYLGGVIQYPVRLLSLAMVGFAFVAADYINSYLVKVGGIHRAIIIVGFGFVVLMMVTSSSTELANYLNTKNQLRTPSQNVLATSWNKFDAHAAKYIFNEKFAMAGEYDYWPKQSMKFSNDIVDHIGKINGHKQRMEPRSITDGIRYKVALRKGDVIDLPFLNYGDGFKISDGFKITKSDRGTVQTRATKSVRSIIVRRRNGILDYCTLLVSIASWVLLAIILAFSRRFRLVRMNGTFHL